MTEKKSLNKMKNKHINRDINQMMDYFINLFMNWSRKKRITSKYYIKREINVWFQSSITIYLEKSVYDRYVVDLLHLISMSKLKYPLINYNFMWY